MTDRAVLLPSTYPALGRRDLMVRLAWYDLDRQEDKVVLHRHGLLDLNQPGMFL